jgi:hypothetical protein
MRKPVLMGAGLGLLVLALVAGGLWLTGKPSEPSVAPELSKTVRSKHSLQQSSEAPVQPAIAGAASQPRSSQESRERRKRLAEVRAEFNALRAQGVQAPPEKMRAIVDELEALSPSGLDPRYFQALRSMVDANARFQALNNELQTLSKSTSPQNSARQQEILAEMRTLGERVAAEARSLQSYVPASPSGVKSP